MRDRVAEPSRWNNPVGSGESTEGRSDDRTPPVAAAPTIPDDRVERAAKEGYESFHEHDDGRFDWKTAAPWTKKLCRHIARSALKRAALEAALRGSTSARKDQAND